MDEAGFDTIAKSLGTNWTRRGTTRGVLGALLAGALLAGPVSELAAKKQKPAKKRNAKRRQRATQARRETSGTNGNGASDPVTEAGVAAEAEGARSCVGRDARCGHGGLAICCQAPRNATAICGSDGGCDFACDAGYSRCNMHGGYCIPEGHCCEFNDCRGPVEVCAEVLCIQSDSGGQDAGQCVRISLHEGLFVPEELMGRPAGPCANYVCVGGSPLLQFDPRAEPPDDCNECTGAFCRFDPQLGGVAEYPPLPAGTPCSQDGGTHCDGGGHCVP